MIKFSPLKTLFEYDKYNRGFCKVQDMALMKQ